MAHATTTSATAGLARGGGAGEEDGTAAPQHAQPPASSAIDFDAIERESLVQVAAEFGWSATAPDAAGGAAALAVPVAAAAAATDAVAAVPAASAASEAGQQERGGSNANDDDRVRIDEFALASERETAREMGWAVAEPVSGGEF
jgi:hypothetical protein